MDYSDVSGLVGADSSMGVISRLPWWAKLGGKLALARLPLPYSWWRALDVFRHGDMHHPKHAYSVFCAHRDRVLAKRTLANEFTCLELGPGDSLLSGLVACAYGASKVYLVDTGDYAVRDLEPYRQMLALLRSYGMPLPQAESALSLEELLSTCGITYLTDGLESLRHIPAGSVDFVWSQVVLEHVQKHEFNGLLGELRRVMRDDAVGSHSVDLRDHLDGALNNLRFTERIWESSLFRHSGFYTNRICYHEMMRSFVDAGFQPTILRTERWESLPLPQRSMAVPFCDYLPENLLVTEFEVLLSPLPKWNVVSGIQKHER